MIDAFEWATLAADVAILAVSCVMVARQNRWDADDALPWLIVFAAATSSLALDLFLALKD